MKKFLFRAFLPLLIVWIIFLSTFLPHPRANAPLSYAKIPQPVQPIQAVQAAATQSLVPLAGDYACILSDDVYFYANADGRRGLFLLPQSYYVRLVEYRSDYCKVEYQTDVSAKRLIGYVKTEELTFVDYTPSRPYLYYVFDLRYTIENAEQTDSTFLTEITVSCIYYGDYLIGSERYCYVLRGEEFGYVPKPVTLTYEENEEYAQYLASKQPEAPPTSNTPSTEEHSSPAQIAILVALCLLVPILAALILKPPRRAPYELDDPT